MAILTHGVALFNVPAVIIIAIISTLLVIGVKESAQFNNVIVFVKLAVILLFLIGASKAVTSTTGIHSFQRTLAKPVILAGRGNDRRRNCIFCLHWI